MPIEVSMIFRGKPRISPELARQQTARKRHPRENANLPLLCLRKEHFGRPLAKAIEDNLDSLHVRIFDCFQSLFHPFDTDPVVTELPCPDKIIKHSENFGMVVKVSRWAMQLKQVQ